MRAAVAAAFAVGFALGMLALAGILWTNGRLQSFAAPQVRIVAAPPPKVIQPRATPVPVTPAPLPPVQTDRYIPGAGAPHIAMPLAGIDPHTLADTFNDPRSDRKHEALDIPAPRGTPVQAVIEGNVEKLFTSRQGGLTVYQFDNDRKYCFYYAHLDHYAPGLKQGALLRQGDVLGYVGTTGNAPPDSPHLHFAVYELGPDKQWWKGNPINPLPLLQ